MKLWVTAVVTAVSTLYALVVLPEELLTSIKNAVAVVEPWMLRVAGIASGPLLAFVFFASDSPFRGNGKTAKWLQSIWPSQEPITKFGCNEHEARSLWFRYFDTWGLPGSPNRLLMVNTYHATYTGRMIHYLTWACCLFTLLTAVTIGADRLRGVGSGSFFENMWIVLGVYAVCWCWLRLANRIGGNGRKPTGAWHRVEDIFGRSRVVFRNEILDESESMSMAIGRVKAMREELLGNGQGPASVES